MRSSLACAARVAHPSFPRDSRTASISGLGRNQPIRNNTPSRLFSGQPQSWGRSRASDKIQHSTCEVPLSTHRHPPPRNSLFAFPTISIAVTCSFCSDWISVRKRLIVNAKTLSDLPQRYIALYQNDSDSTFHF